jgi:hypothetical protein
LDLVNAEVPVWGSFLGWYEERLNDYVTEWLPDRDQDGLALTLLDPSGFGKPSCLPIFPAIVRQTELRREGILLQGE